VARAVEDGNLQTACHGPVAMPGAWSAPFFREKPHSGRGRDASPEWRKSAVRPVGFGGRRDTPRRRAGSRGGRTVREIEKIYCDKNNNQLDQLQGIP
jgi:hypothetical protein